MKSHCHLHFHTKYSLLDAINDSEESAIMAKKDGQPALAITDHGNLYGALEHYKACKKIGIEPILGCEIYYLERSRFEKQTNRNGNNPRNHLTLLAVNTTGWKNLIRLVSDAHINKNGLKPCCDFESLSLYNEGIIALSGCLSSQVSKAILNDEMGKARDYCDQYLSVFGRDRFFLEFMKTNNEKQNHVNNGLFTLMKHMNIRPIASNDVHWPCENDHDIHDTLICRQDSPAGTPKSTPNRMRYDTSELYFKSAAQMRTLFNEMPEACDNTLLIAEMANIEIELGKPKMPVFSDPEEMSEEERFDHEVQKGFQERYPNPTEKAKERLKYEVSIIKKMGFVGYFLILWDIVRFCREKSISVGDGRGSAASSIVLYSLKITNVEPLRWDLLFARFLNPSRVSLPDVDIDVSKTRRNEVIRYIKKKYGENRVAKIGTSLRILAKTAIKTFGKIMEIPYVDHQEICKKIPESPGVKIPEILQNDPELDAKLSKYPKAKEHILRLEGTPSYVGVHAAGILIADRDILDLVPLTKSKDEICTQWTMQEVEECGLVKMDFLGLKNLSIVDECYKLIREKESITKEELEKLSSQGDDPKVFKTIFQKADTLCVFQFESDTMKPFLKQLKPDCLEDLVALNALVRPGPLDSGMTESFIKRRRGIEKTSYLHPKLENSLSSTRGVIAFQEQCMQIARDLANFTEAEADNLRKAIGKKIPELLQSMKDSFIEGCKNNKIPIEIAERIFDDINRFAGYGFCLSHAVGYTMPAYQMAWLKYYYPSEFYAANLSFEKPGEGVFGQILEEAKKKKIKVLLPDINHSEERCTVEGKHIRLGLSRIKGVGEGKAREIFEKKPKDGYSSIAEFALHCTSFDKGTIEFLIKAGAFDFLKRNRGTMAAAINSEVERGKSWSKSAQHGTWTLFGDAIDGQLEPLQDWPKGKSWSKEEIQKAEDETLEFYFSGHPLQENMTKYGLCTTETTKTIQQMSPGAIVSICGIVRDLKIIKIKGGKNAGKSMAKLTLEDIHGRIPLIIFSQQLSSYSEIIEDKAILVFTGKTNLNSDEIEVSVSHVETLEECITSSVKACHMIVDLDQLEDPKSLLPLFHQDGQNKVQMILYLKTSSSSVFVSYPNKVGIDMNFVERAEKILGKGCLRRLR